MKEVLINKFDYEGNGITTLNGKKIFVNNALPNEKVQIEIIENKSNYSKARVKKFIKKSNIRRNSPCPYEECGGCNLLHIHYDDELKFKQNKINELFNNIENINDIIPADNEFNYRNKITIKVDKNIGYYKKNSHDIVPIKKCLLAKNEINEILKSITKLNLKNIKELTIKSSKDTMLIIKGEISNCKDFLNLNVDNILVLNNNKYTCIKGNDFITDTLQDIKLIIKKDSFYQINKKQTIKLYNEIIRLGKFNKNDTVLDMYCGIGTISLFISKYVKKVIGIEINKNAIKSANENKKINNIKNTYFHCLNANEIKITEKVDKIIVDPPRGGLDKKTIEFLNKSNANVIIYVSCNPITLKRDTELLKQFYSLKEITPVDMFPNTHHVECVSVLHQKSPKK